MFRNGCASPVAIERCETNADAALFVRRKGRSSIDPTGKRNGRGAYLCDDRSCWERALSI